MSMEQSDSELPFVIEENRDSVTKMVDKPCGHCEYDRTIVTSHKYAGVHRSECPVCEWYSEDGGKWKAPTTNYDLLQENRKYAEGDGSIELVGEIPSNRYGHDGGYVFNRGGADAIEIFTKRNGRVDRDFHSREYFKTVVMLLEAHEGWLSDLVESEMGKQIRPSVSYNPNATHIGRYAHSSEHSPMWFMTQVNHMDFTDNIIVHIPPTYDGVAI